MPAGSAAWRRTLARQGITLEQLIFQFMIVAIGVWLAIALGEHTNRSERRSQADKSLASVQRQLGQDRAEMKAIIALQRSNIAAVQHFIAEAGKAAPSDSILHAALFEEWK